MDKTIKVLVIASSIKFKEKLKESLKRYRNIEAVMTGDIVRGRDYLVYNNPDILVINRRIDKINILTFLKRVYKYKPIPTIVIGNFMDNKELALELIEIGVLDVVTHKENEFLQDEVMKKMVKKIIAVSIINAEKPKKKIKKLTSKKIISTNKQFDRNKIIAIGASTGGPLALREVITNLPGDMPPILVAQHMPKFFIKSFAEHLDKLSNLKVVEAKDNEVIKESTVYIAPGDRHLEVKRINGSYYTKLTIEEPVHFQRPSVEVLFNSVAKEAGKNAIGVILTGMGRDGAKGLVNMRNKGAYTIGQDKETSIVYGMPKEAFNLGGVKKQLPLDKIPAYLFKLTRK